MEENKKLTRFGRYLKKIGARPSKIAPMISIKPKTISLLATDSSRTIYAEDFYKIVMVANKQAGLTDQAFVTAVDEIFPNRSKTNLLEEFKDYSPESLFFKKHAQQQAGLEKKLEMPENKLSKYFGDHKKRIIAIEMICFIEGMGYDLLTTFKEIYGPIGEDEMLPSLDILNERATIIYQYVKAYNEQDVPGMLAHMADAVVFDNCENNLVTLHLEGIDEFRKQAIDALTYFTERRQRILSLTHKPNATEITVAYEAIVGVDLPDGIKEGDKIQLTGRSVFEFSPTGKISKLTDYS
ncbi:nuclear transport factor 2 family protein [Parapedobacter soli]|uniref:nuclear transport factor 2 family protein n=1 Tax=Parapedobacter soli TaxID=416955 RepID=UPI0021C876BC|nr:nuclear transport factor 2 family protein [Parapedobacter soli]